MALILPEIALLKALEGLLLWLKNDYDERFSQSAEEKSYLYKLFYGIEYNGFNYYEQAKKIFLSDLLDQRRLKVRIFFDPGRAHLPTIHITLPKEDNDSVGLGYNDDGQEMERKFSVKFSLVITSDNYFEVLIVYYTVKSLIMSGFMTFENLGLREISLGGGDLQLQSDIIPSNVFYRELFIDTKYKENFPNMEFDRDDIIKTAEFIGKLII